MSEIRLDRAQPPKRYQAPSAPDIITAYRHDVCKDSGVVIAYRIDSPGGAPYAFKCWCDRGKYDRRPYPRWPTTREGVERISKIYAAEHVAAATVQGGE